MFETGETERAYEKCQHLADAHYENFPVAKLVSKKIRRHVAAVYAFARTADDIADENHEEIGASDPRRLSELARFEAQLDIEDPDMLSPEWRWIFVALSDTIEKFSIPKQLFRDLVSAFAQDVVKKRYSDFPELLDYCRRSANPVGRLVLILHGLRDEKLFKLSDDICSALQLANFWQDMSVDKKKGRIYIPVSDWNGIGEDEIFSGSADSRVRALVKFQVDRTRAMFDSGAGLVKYLPVPLGLEIAITLAGGRAILDKIESQNCDTLVRRPALNAFDKLRLLFYGAASYCFWKIRLWEK